MAEQYVRAEDVSSGSESEGGEDKEVEASREEKEQDGGEIVATSQKRKRRAAKPRDKYVLVKLYQVYQAEAYKRRCQYVMAAIVTLLQVHRLTGRESFRGFDLPFTMLPLLVLLRNQLEDWLYDGQYQLPCEFSSLSVSWILNNMSDSEIRFRYWFMKSVFMMGIRHGGVAALPSDVKIGAPWDVTRGGRREKGLFTLLRRLPCYEQPRATLGLLCLLEAPCYSEPVASTDGTPMCKAVCGLHPTRYKYELQRPWPLGYEVILSKSCALSIV